MPPETLQRLLRHLAACHTIKEVDKDTYTQTTFSEAPIDPSTSGAFEAYFGAIGLMYLNVPKYMASTAYAMPTDPRSNAFHDAFGCNGQTLFDWYSQHPSQAKIFNNSMTGLAASQPAWIDIYPPEHILTGDDGTSTLMVDVGGNLGRDLDFSPQGIEISPAA